MKNYHSISILKFKTTRHVSQQTHVQDDNKMMAFQFMGTY